ncbi:hypothetical protein, partial [Fretibacterium fastidiosum]
MLRAPTEDTSRSLELPGRLRGEVTFEDVHFAYAAGQEVLRGIRLTVRPG